MKRLLASLMVLGLTAVSARAHFIWILPDKDNEPGALVVFSDTLGPDNPKLLDKIVKTQIYLRRLDKEQAIQWTRGKDAFMVSLPGTGPRSVCGVCQYGVLQKGESEPFLLNYYAKAIVAGDASSKQASTAWSRLPLDIVPVAGKFQVLWHGKPLVGAEVECTLPGQEKSEKKKTDKEGTFELGS